MSLSLATAVAQFLRDQMHTIRYSERELISSDLRSFLVQFRKDHRHLLKRVEADISDLRRQQLNLRRRPSQLCDFCRGIYGARPCQHAVL